MDTGTGAGGMCVLIESWDLWMGKGSMTEEGKRFFTLWFVLAIVFAG